MAIKHILSPVEKDLGEFTVRRVLPSPKQPMVGPWIFFDHMGPAEFSIGDGINVRPHPHINLATVTYLFEGEILHRDSLGTVQSIHPGDINLMVAGKGITHSEREREEAKKQARKLHGLQLWHVLPEEDEEVAPSFHHYPAEQLPSFNQGEVPVRVMIGSAYGHQSPVKTFADTLYVEAKLKAGDRLATPQAQQVAIYVAKGSIVIEGESVPQYTMAILNDQSSANIAAVEDSQVAFIGGAKMSKRFIEWNFVSSRHSRIEQAKEDWRQGRFTKVPGDEHEYIPLSK